MAYSGALAAVMLGVALQQPATQCGMPRTAAQSASTLQHFEVAGQQLALNVAPQQTLPVGQQSPRSVAAQQKLPLGQQSARSWGPQQTGNPAGQL